MFKIIWLANGTLCEKRFNGQHNGLSNRSEKKCLAKGSRQETTNRLHQVGKKMLCGTLFVDLVAINNFDKKMTRPEMTSMRRSNLLRWTSYHTHISTVRRGILSYVTVLWQCWDDTHKSRSSSINPCRRRCSFPLADASRRLCCVFFLHEVSFDCRAILVVCLCMIHVFVGWRLRPRSECAPSWESVSSPFVLSIFCWTHLYLDRTDCDRVQRSVIRILNGWISEQFARVAKSSRVRVHQHASSLTWNLT